MALQSKPPSIVDIALQRMRIKGPHLSKLVFQVLADGLFSYSPLQ